MRDPIQHRKDSIHLAIKIIELIKGSLLPEEIETPADLIDAAMMALVVLTSQLLSYDPDPNMVRFYLDSQLAVYRVEVESMLLKLKEKGIDPSNTLPI